MSKTANFNIQKDEQKFELLAPYLASDKNVIAGWGVLNIAQCAQQDGERENPPCWTVGYLEQYFAGCIGDTGSRELEESCKAIWDAAIIPTNPTLKVTLNLTKTADGCNEVDSKELVAFAVANSDSSASKRNGQPRFTIFHFDELIQIKTKKALVEILNTIVCPVKVEAFRNFDHGVTITL